MSGLSSTISNTIATNKKQTTSTMAKTMPRPILKKSPTPSIKMPPVFFSGNETGIQSTNTYDEEFDDEYENMDKVSLDLVSSIKLENNENRFKKSAINSSNKRNVRYNYQKPTFQRGRPRRRPLSAVYVFHSREINTEIIKMLIKSTDGFLEEFKRTVLNDYINDDSELITVFKDKFLPKLKEFLTNGSNQHHQFKQTYELGITLSEPIMSDVENFRKKTEKERFFQSHSASSLKDDFLHPNRTALLDIQNTNILPETVESINGVYGSLPTSSFFDSYSKELKTREDVLLRSSRSNSLKSNQDDEMLVSKARMGNMNKSLVSAATTTKKIVRFADAFGLDLEKVKIITNNSFVDAFSHDYPTESESEQDDSLEQNDSITSKPFLVLIPLFGINKKVLSLGEFFIKLDDYVYDYENRIIRCIAKVKNISFEKRVFARITFNNWNTSFDLDAIYIKSENLAPSKNVTFDYFGFCLVIPERSSINSEQQIQTGSSPKQNSILDDCILRIEFALCYECNHNVYWDNNAGDNYKFQCFFNKTN